MQSFDDVVDLINQMIHKPDLLKKTSEGALDLAEKFDWKRIIKAWEYEIDNLR